MKLTELEGTLASFECLARRISQQEREPGRNSAKARAWRGTCVFGWAAASGENPRASRASIFTCRWH